VRGVSTAPVESAINRAVNHRINKRQQMSWSSRGADVVLQIRIAKLNGELGARVRALVAALPARRTRSVCRAHPQFEHSPRPPTTEVAKQEISRFSCRVRTRMQGSQTPQSQAGARISVPVNIPPFVTASAPTRERLSRLNGWPAHTLSTLRRMPHDNTAHHSVWFATPSLRGTCTRYLLSAGLPAHDTFTFLYGR
jgi:hypothetical protein